MSVGAAEAAPHPAGLPPHLPSRKVVQAKAKGRVNPDHLLLLAFAISIVGGFARTGISANSNMSIRLPQHPEKGLSPKLEPNLRLPLFESLDAMRPLVWPSIIFPMMMKMSI
jgi:hypothetical protein